MESINICYWGTDGNWGDAINDMLCSKLSGKKVIQINASGDDNRFRYYCIGSILQTVQSTNFEVWGTGFIHKQSKLNYKPNKIHAVRGPLTRDLLLNQGFDCPEIYGDPALLFPLFYKPIVKKRYKYGIIPHYIDSNNSWVRQFENHKDVKVINILDTPGTKFIDEIHECEILLSSSLHGIIAGDAYGIPSYWIELSDKVQGNGFKFKDYFMSVDRHMVEPLKPNLDSNIKSLSSGFYDYQISIDLNKLLNSCPFKK